MTLKDFFEVTNYKITEGSEYQWSCYGDNSYQLDSWCSDQDGHTVSVIYDTKTQVVYAMMAYDYGINRAYRWQNPDFTKAYHDECVARNCNDTAWDDVAYIEIEVEQDFLEKARAIAAEQEYDARIAVPLDLSEDDLLKLMTLAHEADLTLNDYVEKILLDVINNAKA